MGCNASSPKQFEPTQYDKMWNQMNIEEVEFETNVLENTMYSDWKILRINLISTFKDFKNERMLIHKLIEEEFMPIILKKKLFIQLEDFNSGSKALYEDPESVYLLSHCMEQSRAECEHPIYIHLLGDCAGYIIEDNFPDDNILRKYGLSRGLSLGESAVIMNGMKNANALFLHRNNSFLSELPFNTISFTDDEVNRKRAGYFARTIKRTVALSNFHTYSCKTKGINNPHQKTIVLTDLEPMINIVKEFLETKLRTFSYSASATVPIKKKILKHYQNSILPFVDETMAELETKCSTPGLIQLVGSYGSGKSTLLARLLGKIGTDYSFIIARKGMTTTDIQQTILDDIGIEDKDYFSTLSTTSRRLLIAIDNADILEKSDINAILPSSFHYVTVVLTLRKPMMFMQHQPTVVTIPAINEVKAIEVIATYADTSNMSKNEFSSSQTSRELSNKIVKFDTQTGEKSIDDIERGKEVSTWTMDKCKIIASLVRFGISDEKAKALTSLNLVSICEAEINLLETEARGHLLIACLCFLTIVDSGLTEPELRYLLAPENKILPAGIKRKSRNIPFDYSLDNYGSSEQVAAIRWRYVLLRLEHCWTVIDKNVNHVVLSGVFKRVVAKKFLSIDLQVTHFKRRLWKLINKEFPWIFERCEEIKSFL